MISLLTLTAILAAPPEPFDLKDGDRVAWLGSTLIEREQQYGHWEEAITQLNRGKKITFRNLGWSGETVWGESRAAFDPVSKGYQRLIELTKEVKPTVIVFCFGSNESFAGEQGLQAFHKQYSKLISDLATTKARRIFMTPIPFEGGSGMGNVNEKNRILSQYCQVTRSIAQAESAPIVDLFSKCNIEKAAFTENGLHPSDSQYERLAEFLWNDSKTIQSDPKLLTKIVAKNELFFHRWRPQNETYLFGFRKHEQGKNAKEIVEFDPLISKAEEEIQKILNAK